MPSNVPLSSTNPSSQFVSDRFAITMWASFTGLSSMLIAHLAVLGLSLQGAMVLGGVVFASSYAAQLIHYDIKKHFFKEVLCTHEKDLAIKICIDSTDEQWCALRHGIEGQKSIFNQFKSCINPNDWKNSKYYYSGFYLAEVNPRVNINGIELERRLKVL